LGFGHVDCCTHTHYLALPALTHYTTHTLFGPIAVLLPRTPTPTPTRPDRHSSDGCSGLALPVLRTGCGRNIWTFHPRTHFCNAALLPDFHGTVRGIIACCGVEVSVQLVSGDGTRPRAVPYPHITPAAPVIRFPPFGCVAGWTGSRCVQGGWTCDCHWKPGSPNAAGAFMRRSADGTSPYLLHLLYLLTGVIFLLTLYTVRQRCCAGVWEADHLPPFTLFLYTVRDAIKPG